MVVRDIREISRKISRENFRSVTASGDPLKGGFDRFFEKVRQVDNEGITSATSVR
jgi:hypothetical protein